METQPLANIDGYSLFIQHFANNYYQINICDPDSEVHQFEGVYSSPEAAIARGQEVIKSFQFWRRKKTPAEQVD